MPRKSTYFQICNHPALVQAIVDDEAKETAGLDPNSEDDDLISKMTNMSLCLGNNKDDSDSADYQTGMGENVLIRSNPVFQKEVASSKIKTVIEELQRLKMSHEKDKTIPFEKAIVVSQWTSMLDVVKVHIENLGLKIAEINGKIIICYISLILKADAEHPLSIINLN